MPEGDTIFRTARAMHRILAGKMITRTETILPALARAPGLWSLEGRTVDRVASRGKHLLIYFSGDLVLRTHLRLRGSWHLYRRGDRWKRPLRDMHIVLETADVEAVAFEVPDAQLLRGRDLTRTGPLQTLGPDLLDPEFDRAEALRRLIAQPDREIATGLLDQRNLAGIGNVIKSEVLFVSGVHPAARVGELDRSWLEKLVDESRRLLKISVTEGGPGRRTTGRNQPGARLWVYGRARKPCRRCGTAILYARRAPDMRSTYWCPKCQPENPGEAR
jgi:endonuclease VIII